MTQPNAPLRILHVSQPTHGGVGRVVAGLASWQSGQGHDVTVACSPGTQLAEELADDTHLVRWDARRSPHQGVPGELRALRRIVAQTRPDVVHLHSSKAGLIGRLLLRRRVPTIYQPHGWSFYAATGLVGRAATLWEKVALRWTSALVCVSEAEAAQGRATIDASARVVRNGVDTTYWSPRDRRGARDRLGVAAAATVVVCVGRFDEAKGHVPFAPWWRELLAQRPGTELVLVGNGDLEDEVRAAYAGTPTRFVTDCTDARDWLAASDAVVAPSRWEGGALAPLEAMSMGRPVVGYDVGGLATTLGEAGLAVEPQDGAALVAALARAIDDDGLGDRMRAAAVARHDASLTYGRLTELAHEVARR